MSLGLCTISKHILVSWTRDFSQCCEQTFHIHFKWYPDASYIQWLEIKELRVPLGRTSISHACTSICLRTIPPLTRYRKYLFTLWNKNETQTTPKSNRLAEPNKAYVLHATQSPARLITSPVASVLRTNLRPLSKPFYSPTEERSVKTCCSPVAETHLAQQIKKRMLLSPKW